MSVRASSKDIAELDILGEQLIDFLDSKGPQTDDELHAWIKTYLNIDIPRVAVCDGHVAPFQFIADVYFERVGSVVVMANRGGMKTLGAAIIHLLNSLYKPNCESASVGAIEAQALRAYAHLQAMIKLHGKVDVPERHPDVVTSIMRETKFRNGAKVEVLAGTVSAVNGPHPQKVHFDEVELADPVVFQESRSMSQSKLGIMAQDFITSTRKRAHGAMSAIIDEIEEAKRAGLKPPYELLAWCVFESAANQPNCMAAGKGKQDCGCDQIVKGKWEDGTPRIFKDVCGGRLSRSAGWVPLHDMHKAFRLVSQPVWEAQHECSRPSTQGLVIPQFTRTRHGVKWFQPDPDNGMVYMSVDFGGSNPHGVGWYQVLEHDVYAHEMNQLRTEEPRKHIPAGSRVCFDEIYKAEIGNNKLAALIKEREAGWAAKYPRFRVTARFADMQAKAARLDFAEQGLRTSWWTTRETLEHIKILVEWFNDDRFFVDLNRCPMFCDEIEAWHYPDSRGKTIDGPENPVNDFDHMMSSARFFASNIHANERRGKVNKSTRAANSPHVTRNVKTVTSAGATRYATSELKPEDWRGRLGGPIDG